MEKNWKIATRFQFTKKLQKMILDRPKKVKNDPIKGNRTLEKSSRTQNNLKIQNWRPAKRKGRNLKITTTKWKQN